MISLIALRFKDLFNSDIRPKYLKAPLYKNSIFLMFTAFATYGFGFLFWIIAARLYSAEDVGIATALISSNIMLATFSGLGLDSSLIRSFPNSKDKSSIFSTCAIVTTIFALLLGVIFISGIDIWSPELNFQKFENIFIYLLFLAANSLLTIILTTFIAMRRTEFNFLGSLILGLRVIILFPLVSIGAIGIFAAYGISFVLAILVALIIVDRIDLKPSFEIDAGFLKEGFHFSTGNYVSWLLITAPNLIMPIMVLNVLGAMETAHYYIPFSIASLLFIIPTAISTSLFVEGSHGESLIKIASKSLIAAISILIPGVILLDHFGRWLLELIGNNYIAGLELFRLLIYSSFFVSIIYIYFSIKKVQKKTSILIFISGIVSMLFIGLSYKFMLEDGLVGIGYAHIISYGIGVLIIILDILREHH